MHSALACCTGGLGLSPTVAKAKKFAKIQMVYSPSLHKVVGHQNGARHNNLHDIASPLSRYR